MTARPPGSRVLLLLRWPAAICGAGASGRPPTCARDAAAPCVRRGVHALSARATSEYEAARESVAELIGAADAREVVFTRNASEAINLVAASWGGANLRAGDEIVLSVAEHHSNLVPWQLLAQRTGAVLK